MDVAPVGIDREADAEPVDRVEPRAPRGHIEILRDELAPRREPGPVEIRDGAVLRPDDAQAAELREHELGAREVCGVDDEAVRESYEVLEVARAHGRGARP